MTKTKKVSADRPVEVRVESEGEVYFVTLWKDGVIRIRPKGSRAADSTAMSSVGGMYRRIKMAEAKTTVKSRISRNLLKTEKRNI